MLATALRELRHHPGRYLATLIAIIISVGFLAASSVVTATESQAMGRQQGAPYTHADLAVSFDFTTMPVGVQVPDSLAQLSTSDIAAKIRSASPSVDQVWSVEQTSLMLMHGQASRFVTLYPNPPAQLAWATVGAAKTPQAQIQLGADDVLLSPATASALGVGVGDSVTDAYDGTTLRVAGITNDPSTRLGADTAFGSSALMAQLGASGGWGLSVQYAVHLSDPRDVDAAQAAIRQAMTSLTDSRPAVSVDTGEQAMADAVTSATRDIDVMKYFLWIFATIALVVGMITIANTFTILLAQRRQQLGLLRAVGASGAQVRRSVWLEALTLGLVGSLLGIGLAYALAAAVGGFTGSIHYGLAVPGLALVIALGIGMVVTVLACVLPARRATRVPVLDALRPIEVDVAARRLPLVRAIVCGLLTVAGVVGCVLSLRGVDADRTLLFAVAGAGLLAIGVLFGAPLFIPVLLRGVGGVLRGRGPVVDTAARNVVRDPRRSSATATALMLAVGLIVTLQVGAASVRDSALDKIASAYPVGLWLASSSDGQGIPSDVRQQASRAQGVSASVTLSCVAAFIQGKDDPAPIFPTDPSADVTVTATSRAVCAYDSAIAKVAPGSPTSIPDGQALVSPPNPGYPLGKSINIWPTDATSTSQLAAARTPVASNLLRDTTQVLVSPATMAELQRKGFVAAPAVMWFAVSDTSQAVRSIGDITGADTPGGIGNYMIGGAAPLRDAFEQVLDLLVDIVTALLAVAVVIALVGVSNTLSLSVIERTRESALLRALGLQRGQLRLMLLYEALLLTLVGAVVGAVFGGFFGYLGARAVMGQMYSEASIVVPLHLSVDWPRTLILLAVLVVAAALASLLPGRRAASATPVEALAEV